MKLTTFFLYVIPSLACCASDAGGIKIAIAGDSTVKTYSESDITRGWGQTIGYWFKDNTAIENHAEGGRSTKTFIEEKRWDKILLSKPDYVLLQFGHNDSHEKGRPESTDAQTDFKDYLRKYADDAKKADIKLIFITPVHRRTYDKNGALASELKPYADAMKELAAEKGVPLIDLYTLSGDMMTTLGPEGSISLFCKESDRSHFSQYGAEKVAELIVNELKKQKNPLSSYLRDNMSKSSTAAENKLKKSTLARIDIVGKDSGVRMVFNECSENLIGAQAEWMKEDKDKRLVAKCPVQSGWAQESFSFTPENSGSVIMAVMADGGNSDSDTVDYDLFTVSGCEFGNGDFEELDSKAQPAGWGPMNMPVCDSSSGTAKSGKTYVKCSMKNRFNRTMAVKEGQKVTVTFWVRASE